MRTTWWWLFALAFGVAAVGGAEPRNIPGEAFFQEPRLARARISDDGKKVLFLLPDDKQHLSIGLYDLASKKVSLLFKPNDYSIEFAFWKGDRIVFGGEVGGNESDAIRSIDENGTDLRDLNESFQENRPVNGPIGGSLFSRLPNDPRHVLVAGMGAARDSEGALVASGDFGFYKLDVKTGERSLIELWSERAIIYFVDETSGTVYGRSMQSGPNAVIELKNAAGEYKRVAEFPAGDVPWQFLGLLPGGKQALVQVRDAKSQDRSALYAFDLATMKLGRLLYVPAQGEIQSVFRDRRTGRVLGAASEFEKPTIDWFDPMFGRAFASLAATFPDRALHLADYTESGDVLVVVADSDRDPGAIYVFDTKKPQLALLGKVNSTIDPSLMAVRRPIAYKARDGLEIHGYVTEPRGREGKVNPLIIHPHGGPFGIRDDWDFEPETEFLASRGYTVLEVNYRGSGGYGAKFEEAGKREWGRAMQDDLTDAVKWAIAQHLTAADRVAIFGASYGGYATLAGLVFTPELYQCGVNYVGVSDLKLIAKPSRDKGRYFDDYVQEWIGTDTAELNARSPVNFVQNIRVPTLHAYGENDPRVDIQNWRELEAKLKEYHKPYEFFREKDEGHGFHDEAARVRFYKAVEAFFAKNLPVKD